MLCTRRHVPAHFPHFCGCAPPAVRGSVGGTLLSMSVGLRQVKSERLCVGVKGVSSGACGAAAQPLCVEDEKCEPAWCVCITLR